MILTIEKGDERLQFNFDSKTASEESATYTVASEKFEVQFRFYSRSAVVEKKQVQKSKKAT